MACRRRGWGRGGGRTGRGILRSHTATSREHSVVLLRSAELAVTPTPTASTVRRDGIHRLASTETVLLDGISTKRK